MLIQAPDFSFPIRVEQELRQDPQTGEEVIERSIEMAADRLLVRFKGEVDEVERTGLIAAMGGREIRQLGTQPVFEVHVGEAQIDSVPLATRRFQSGGYLPFIDYVEPDYILHAQVIPNDPKYSDETLWGMHNTGQNDGLNDADIDAPEGWDIRTSSDQVVVAVIDTGVSHTHEDLSANMWRNPGEIADNGIDDDGNGYIDDVHGVDVINNDSDPMDDHGHGTHCAGTIGGVGNNGIGVAGVAWETKIMGVKFLSAYGSGSLADAVVSVDYVAQMGADLSSNSWGGGGYSQALRDAIESAGSLFVAAAGNSFNDNDERASYPSAYDLSNIIAVAAMQRDGKMSNFSNYGVESVDVAAPGSDIYSCWIGDEKYKSISGTSMATPHVSGIIALLLAEYPNDSQFHQINRLVYSVDKTEEFDDKVRSGGVASLASALKMVDPPFPPVFVKRPAKKLIVKKGDDLSLIAEVISETEVTLQWYFAGEFLEGETSKMLELGTSSLANSGVYMLRATNEDGSVETKSKVEVIESNDALAQALDTELYSVYTYGDSKWTPYLFDFIEGDASAQSGDVDQREESILFIEVEGPGSMSFSWRLQSSEYGSLASFLINGVVENYNRSTGEWLDITKTLDEAKTYRLEWRFSKSDWFYSEGGSLFLDGFEFHRSGESPAAIIEHPKNAVFATGSTGEFSVLALGDDLMYQWYKNGDPLNGAISDRLILTGLSSADEGSYHVVVSNQYGESVSRVATLVVDEIVASIVDQPKDLTVDVGGFAVFRANATGTQPITFQWYFDGKPIEGATNSQLKIKPAQIGDAGEYYLTVRNPFTPQAVESDRVELRVNEIVLRPQIVLHPESGWGNPGDSIELFSVAEGALPMAYQWYKESVSIEGADGRRLKLDHLEPQDTGLYYMEATNAYGSEKSSEAQIYVVGDLGEAVEQPDWNYSMNGPGFFFPQDEVSFDGEDSLQSSMALGEDYDWRTLSTYVEGPTNLSFYWKLDTNRGSGSFYLSAGGEFRHIKGESGWNKEYIFIPGGSQSVYWSLYTYAGAIGWLDKFELNPAPIIYKNPLSKARFANDIVEFSVQAKGAGELSYQWYKDGVPLQGETDEVLRAGVASRELEGNYWVSVSSEHGEAQSEKASFDLIGSMEEVIGESGLQLVFGGEKEWEPNSTKAYEGKYSLKSGEVFDDEESWFETTVEGPINLEWRWMMTNENCCPSLRMEMDGERVWSGYTPFGVDPFWQHAVYRVPLGAHTLRWVFTGPYSSYSDAGSEAWIDNLRMTKAPVFQYQPTNKKIPEGGSFSFWVSVLGEKPFDYRWYKDGELLEETYGGLIISDASEADMGDYFCIVVDKEGRETRSDSARLEVVTGLNDAVDYEKGNFYSWSDSFNWRNQEEESWDGEDALYTEIAGRYESEHLNFELYEYRDGSLPPSLRTKIKIVGMGSDDRVTVSSNGIDYAVFDSDTNWTTVILPLNSGYGNIRWSIIRGNSLGSEPLRVYLDKFEESQAPVIVRQPDSWGSFTGGRVAFEVETVGDDLRYQWKRNGVPILGETRPIFEIQNVGHLNTGSYHVEIRNSHGVVSSESAELKLVDDFGEAVGHRNGRFRTKGWNIWKIDSEVGENGSKSLKAGSVKFAHPSRLYLEVEGPAEVKFQWKNPSRSISDDLRLYIDGEYSNHEIGFEPDWKEVALMLYEGEHELMWEYRTHQSSGEVVASAWITDLKVIHPGVAYYDQWASEMFVEGDPSISGPYADPDGDGLVNYVEYALVQDPFAPGSLPQLTPNKDDKWFSSRLTLTRRNNTGDLSYRMEKSSDLKRWSLVMEVPITRLPGDRGSVSESVGVSLFFTPDSSLFYRLGIYYDPVEN